MEQLQHSDFDSLRQWERKPGRRGALALVKPLLTRRSDALDGSQPLANHKRQAA